MAEININFVNFNLKFPNRYHPRTSDTMSLIPGQSFIAAQVFPSPFSFQKFGYRLEFWVHQLCKQQMLVFLVDASYV